MISLMKMQILANVANFWSDTTLESTFKALNVYIYPNYDLIECDWLNNSK